jgi:putative FmdB family regulatory protein
MPIYEYRCKHCGEQAEILVRSEPMGRQHIDQRDK